MSAKAMQICFLYLFLISNGNLLRYLGFAANGIGFAADGIGFAADGIGFAADGIGLVGDWYVFYIYF